jgi:hypothetical protein
MSGRRKKKPAPPPQHSIEIEIAFPRLQSRGYRITSPQSPLYNCIAWAAGETHRWWWPEPRRYWPDGIPRDDSLSSFLAAFGTLNFSQCQTPDLEPGVEKVALYGRDGRCMHAARQLSSGLWSSKLGMAWDISHALDDLAGNKYGQVLAILGRPHAVPP